jgi:hypothetical protein
MEEKGTSKSISTLDRKKKSEEKRESIEREEQTSERVEEITEICIVLSFDILFHVPPECSTRL